MGASAWDAGRRLRIVPVVLALAAAGVAGFLFAQWASRPKPLAATSVANVPSASSAPSEAPAPPTVAARTLPPATYAAPYVPPAGSAQAAAPAARPRSSAPVEPAAEPRARSAAAPTPAPLAPVVPTFTLQAVTQQDGQPVAIVNGQLVRVGDLVEGARVVRIDADAVELDRDGRRIVIGF